MTGSLPAPASLGLPAPWPDSLLQGIAARNRDAGTRFVVLDDDPLGGQALHDVPVLLSAAPALLSRELAMCPIFLLVTNTRAMARTEAIAKGRETGIALREAELPSGHRVTPMWRSDSTLRGHFWWEMQAVQETLHAGQGPEPVYVFLPYFGDGGRYTVGDVQYVLQGERLVPAAETEFARDPAFAYKTSHLPSWLEALTEGRIRAHDVASIAIAELREDGPGRVAERLAAAQAGSAVVVNAADDRDLEVFVAGLQQAEAAGRRFLCSGAAPFIRVRAGQPRRSLLEAGDLGLTGGTGGLLVAGSYAGRTSEQLAYLTQVGSVTSLEVAPDPVTLQQQAAQVTRELLAGRHVVLSTPRAYRAGAAGALTDALAEVVAHVDTRPGFLLVKGGTTASRLAAGLGVQRALVLGQLMAGVPVWRLGEESRWPGLPFIIFPGNVGTKESLAEALARLGP